MLRTFTVIAVILASVGTARAENQIAVATAGKSPRIVRAELFRAAYKVCVESVDPLASQSITECTRDSFDDAVQRFHDLQRAHDAPAHRVASR